MNSAHLPRWAIVERGLVVLAIVVGAALRSVRYWRDPISLWLDEAEWAVRLMERPLATQAIRPFGFLWSSRLLARTFDPGEATLRLLPYACGILALPAAYWCARALFRQPSIRVLVVWLFALHPLLIDFSREFKPYSVEVLCHLVVIGTTARAIATGSAPRRVWVALAVPLLALPFAYNVIFAYPAVYGALFWRALALRARREAALVGGVAVMAASAVLALQLGLLSRVNEKSYGAAYWGWKYDVFRITGGKTMEGQQSDSALRWVLTKYLELAGGPAFSPSEWHLHASPSRVLFELREAHLWVWIGAFLCGTVVLFRRDRQTLMCLASPLVFMGLFNAFGRWPLGLFRPNLFALVYTTFIACAAFDRLAAGRIRLPKRFMTEEATTWPGFALAALLVLPRVTFAAPRPEVKETRPWMGHSEMGRAVSTLVAEGSIDRRLPLFLDYYSFHTLPFYERVHAGYARRAVKERFRPQLAATPKELKASIRRTRGAFWVLTSRGDEVEKARGLVREGCSHFEEFDLGPHHLLARCEDRTSAR